MSDHQTMFGFSVALEGTNDRLLEYTGNHLVGGNPNNEDGYWDTKEDAFVNFALQFSEMVQAAQHHHLFVRKAPELVRSDLFEGGAKWRMIGRFSIAKLKEKNT